MRGVKADQSAEEKCRPLKVACTSQTTSSLKVHQQNRSRLPLRGRSITPASNSHWKANYPTGMNASHKLVDLHVAKNSLQYRRYADDFAFQEIGNIWTNTGTGNFTDDKVYVVQTNVKVAERCLLLATAPGDLVIDPTCGSGTTAYVAEQWGKRWITCDTSRVPLALARQRLLTATFPWYTLKSESHSPATGFEYKSRQNRKGEEVGA